ncbi:uncharacterized protein [Triticum aestivum]|uniref:uncharacterized protein n=1 Tax=Triticum aestivum TaxID=4565 RepID=UPI001D01BE17|nr:uncharacterized protein LOC123142594 [Triticum aestivum]
MHSRSLPLLEDDDLVHRDANNCMSNGSDLNAQPDEDNHMVNEKEDGDLVHHDDNTSMANGSDLVAQPDEHNQMPQTYCLGYHPSLVPYVGVQLVEEQSERGKNLGKGLNRMSRAWRSKMPLIIQERKIRPKLPLLAAKFATERNIAVRDHVPVLQCWKDYKNHPGSYNLFSSKVAIKYHMDTEAAPVTKACTQMMKSAVRQQQYRLKKKYFDPFPLNLVTRISPVKSMTDDQWNALVESWKNPTKMEISQKNKANHAQVKFHQTTGSRSYPVHCVNLGEKYKDEEPNALDLFKECHYSNKKKGYTDTVQSAVVSQENKRQCTTDGQQPISVTNVVPDVLTQHTKKPKFLQHVGIQHVRERTSGTNLEAQLAAEKKGSAELREIVNTLTKKVEELEEASRNGR